MRSSKIKKTGDVLVAGKVLGGSDESKDLRKASL